MTDMVKHELWKEVEGFSGYYVSNIGRIKSFQLSKDGKILKTPVDKRGYKQVNLTRNGEHHHLKVHRLVAIAFIDNPDNKPFVNHMDEDKTNNSVGNLDWVTPIENVQWGTAIQRQINTQRKTSKFRKPILAVDEQGKQFLFSSIRECAREIPISYASIHKVLQGNYASSRGYTFKEMI